MKKLKHPTQFELINYVTKSVLTNDKVKQIEDHLQNCEDCYFDYIELLEANYLSSLKEPVPKFIMNIFTPNKNTTYELVIKWIDNILDKTKRQWKVVTKSSDVITSTVLEHIPVMLSSDKQEYSEKENIEITKHVDNFTLKLILGRKQNDDPYVQVFVFDDVGNEIKDICVQFFEDDELIIFLANLHGVTNVTLKKGTYNYKITFSILNKDFAFTFKIEQENCED